MRGDGCSFGCVAAMVVILILGISAPFTIWIAADLLAPHVESIRHYLDSDDCLDSGGRWTGVKCVGYRKGAYGGRYRSRESMACWDRHGTYGDWGNAAQACWPQRHDLKQN